MQGLYQFKPVIERQLTPLAEDLAKRGGRPNQIILGGLFVIVLYALLAVTLSFPLFLALIFPLICLLRITADQLGALLLKKQAQISKTDKVLTESSRILADLMLYLPLILLFPALFQLLLALVILGILIEFQRLYGAWRGTDVSRIGYFSDLERHLLFSLLAWISLAGDQGLGAAGFLIFIGFFLAMMAFLQRWSALAR